METQESIEKRAQELLEEKEAESRMRTYTEWYGKVLTVLLCSWAVFQLYFTTFGVINAVNLRAFHCIFGMTPQEYRRFFERPRSL